MKKSKFTLLSLFVFSALSILSQDQIVIKTVYLDQNDTIWVFAPNNYTDSDELPLVFLLHGWSGNYQQWDNIMGCQEYADKYNIIIVCPDGLYDSWYINSPTDEKSQFESFFFKELVPKIFHEYKVDTKNVFITGLSMGGHGSLYLYSKKPELFKSAGSMSGVLDLIMVTKGLGVEELLGVENNVRIDSVFFPYSITGRIEAIKNANKPIIFSCGVDDKYYEVNNDFRKLCDLKGIDATYIADPGTHDANYWRKAIKYHFLFFEQIMKK